MKKIYYSEIKYMKIIPYFAVVNNETNRTNEQIYKKV